ncbi:MAG: hypothetical protein KL787_04910, partial [Taibaiella sp.]|nr:hypothetical protein [Taibaiella sp.]
GVATNDKLLSHNANNFLAAVTFREDKGGACFLDISTGEIYTAEGSREYIDRLLSSMQPSEVLLSKTELKAFQQKSHEQYYCYGQEDWIFQYSYAYELVLRHFETQSLKGFGIEEWILAITSIGAAIHYLKDTEHPNLEHLNQIQRINEQQFVWMDRFTIRNLELLNSNHLNGKCLIETIDRTATTYGGPYAEAMDTVPPDPETGYYLQAECGTYLTEPAEPGAVAYPPAQADRRYGKAGIEDSLKEDQSPGAPAAAEKFAPGSGDQKQYR